MATVTLKGNPIDVAGFLPAIGSKAPAFHLVANDLSEVALATFAGKQVVLNIFPSLDTPTCAASVRRFNKMATQHPDTVVLCISADLPFAQTRFCGAAGLHNVKTLSAFRSASFAHDYGVKFVNGPLTGLTARAVIIIAADGKIKYTQLVQEVSEEPNYDAVLAAL